MINEQCLVPNNGFFFYTTQNADELHQHSGIQQQHTFTAHCLHRDSYRVAPSANFHAAQHVHGKEHIAAKKKKKRRRRIKFCLYILHSRLSIYARQSTSCHSE